MTHLKGAELRREREHNERAWMVWNISALGTHTHKRIPDLKKLMVIRRQPGRRQTPQEQQAILERWLGK